MGRLGDPRVWACLAAVRQRVDDVIWSDPRQVRWVVTHLLEALERLVESEPYDPGPPLQFAPDEPDEPLALREQAVRLREQGYSQEKIAQELGVGRHIIRRLLIGDPECHHC